MFIIGPKFIRHICVKGMEKKKLQVCKTELDLNMGIQKRVTSLVVLCFN